MREIGPQSHLLIPGLNPYLPWTYGWIALVVTIIIHEAGRGIVARVHNIKIESTGNCPIQTALNATDTQPSTVERNIFQPKTSFSVVLHSRQRAATIFPRCIHRTSVYEGHNICWFPQFKKVL